MNYEQLPNVLHWNYRGFTEFPLQKLRGEESDVVDIYLKENLISRIPSDICKLSNLESLYLSGNDITELPREISKLRCLKCLDISGNRLRFIPEEIAGARNLKFLILDENELKQLPLRLAEIRTLRYLSVCDNQLQWLPQRPVYNYHHCEFRFWRNVHLKTIPYSLWYHMFREQQTRSLNIGCLDTRNETTLGRCLKLTNRKNSEFRISTSDPYNIILHSNKPSPPSLFELSKRKFYQLLCMTTNKLNEKPFSGYMDIYKDNLNSLEKHLGDFKIHRDEQNNDINGNYESSPISQDISLNEMMGVKSKRTYVPADIIEEYFSYLPSFLKRDLSHGPYSRCENIMCKRPVFDFAFMEFCVQKIILIDKTEDVTLSAVFCSKNCSEVWKGEKHVLEWEFM